MTSETENKLVDRFLIYKQMSEGRSVRTVDKYRRYLILLDAFLGETSLEDATRDQLLDFSGMHAHKEMKMTPTSRIPMVAAIRTFYAWMLKSDLIDKDPARDIPYPKKASPLPVAMQTQNAEKILMQPDLETFIGVRDLAILSVLAGCGPRVSGVCRLNQSDLIFGVDDGIEFLAIRFNEKGDKERLVPAPIETLTALRMYLGHPEMDGIDRNLPNGEKVLFVSTRNMRHLPCDYCGENRRIHVRSIDSMIKRYGEAAGIPREQLSAHSFRHMFGAEMAEDEVNTLIMQRLLGHASPKTTEIYSHIAMRRLRSVVQRSNPLGKINTPVSELIKMLKGR